MSSKNSKIITINMPLDLLAQIDVLAKRDFATRSDILRQAALSYVRRSNLDAKEVERLSPEYAEQKPKPEPKPGREYDYEALAKKYPHVHGDREILAFLDDNNNNRL